MFKQTKNAIDLLKSIFISPFVIASIGLSTFVTTSCSKTKNNQKDSSIDPEATTIHIAGITNNDNCKVNSSLFPDGSSHKFSELESDIVLGVNELKNYDVTEVTITISSKSAKTIKIMLKNGIQTSGMKYNGITFEPEDKPQEFGDKAFSKILRVKKETLKEIISDLNCQTNDVNLQFDFDKIVKEPGAETKIYVSLSEKDDKKLRDTFIGMKINGQGNNNDWYKEGEYDVAIDELSSISLAYEKDGIGWASDDQQFFIHKEFENISEDEGKFVDEQIEYNKPTPDNNITTFTLKNKITVFGDVCLTSINSEYVKANTSYYYTIVDDSDETNTNTIFLSDESVETSDISVPISGFYIDKQGQEQTVEYDRESFDYVVNVGKNITSVGDDFLSYCENIEYVNFINGFNNIYHVGDGFMAHCPKLKNIQINGITNDILTIGSDSYNSMIEIGSFFLAYCESFNQQVKITNKVTIREDFLANCKEFNSNVTFELHDQSCIYMNAFMYECLNMTSTIVINKPTQVTNFDNVFFNCSIFTLSTSISDNNSYKNGVKIKGDTNQINMFMDLLPDTNGPIFYRHLIPDA